MIEPKATDVGRRVLYFSPGFDIGYPMPEDGVITAINGNFVFVRYGADTHSKATRRCDLQWMEAQK